MRYGVAFSAEDLEMGARVAIDGFCQSVVAIDFGVIFFEAIKETWERTTLDTLNVGQKVNVERSARLGDEIGGHLLSGHIYCKAEIVAMDDNIFTIDVAKNDYLFEKGFVAIDGMSLTVVKVMDHAFTVHLIPETLKWFKKGVGDLVNIEFDSLTIAAVETVKKYIADAF